MRAVVTKKEGHHFEFQIRGMKGDLDVPIDPAPAKGPSPKEMALAALCGCTGTDVIDLLKKFNVTYEQLQLEARAELTDKHPKIFAKIELTYRLESITGNEQDILEAVKRSTHQYSGMAAVLSKACPINYTIKVDGKEIGKGDVAF